ncbi:glutamate 2,3-aminomutase [Candidatus Izemoplasma sp. B36]|uniref:glutamate 2,3-aminomutase n=1 Tax=Candidatus Izemoplasma sp. B36 TaxID=3242468 RepID=UPI0035581D13
MKTKREIALDRAKVLKSRITEYLEARKSIPKGLEKTKDINQTKGLILSILGATESDWNDWKWQLKNRISTVEQLQKFIKLNKREIDDIIEVSKVYRWAISPYYLSLINFEDKVDPIRLLAIPTILELKDKKTTLDPMGEEYNNPSGLITRRYPDRLIINITNECATYCRHCQRRRNIGEVDRSASKKSIMESVEYIRANEEIRDVLLTGGDPLTLSNSYLEWILQELRKIPHLEIIRIGTRTIVTMPQRITDELCSMLKKYHPIYINTQFNHPMEVTEESKLACEKLSEAGIPLGNQAVLLNGINNDKYVMKCLNQELLKARVRPYYIFHAKKVRGTKHFNTSVNDGLEIMENLRGYTSGLAIPTYIINAPMGMGKTPILPKYLLYEEEDFVVIRTWENKIMKYPNKKTFDVKNTLKKRYK